MEQTAVEWLETQIVKFHNWKLNPIYDENCFDEIELNKAINQAKEIEAQKLIEMHDKGFDSVKQLNDDYAIEFLQWCENKNVFSPSVIHKPTYYKLLIQFKKEKGWI